MRPPRTLMIVGLGNHGPMFTNTRHNAGMLFLNHLLNVLSPVAVSSSSNSTAGGWQTPTHHASVAHLDIQDAHQLAQVLRDPQYRRRMRLHLEPRPCRLVLVRPRAFMNTCGPMVDVVRRREQGGTGGGGGGGGSVLVVHDELDKALGKVGLKVGGSINGHNGLRSLLHVMDNDFTRLRIGIGRPESRRAQAITEFVLGPFTQQELDHLHSESFDKALFVVWTWLERVLDLRLPPPVPKKTRKEDEEELKQLDPSTSGTAVSSPTSPSAPTTTPG